MAGFQMIPAVSQSIERNVLGSEVTRIHTEGAILTVVRGKSGDVVPAHGYSKGAAMYVVSGQIDVDGAVLSAGDAGTYAPPAAYFSVKFLTDATYVVARTATDQITLPDIGERAAHSLDAG